MQEEKKQMCCPWAAGSPLLQKYHDERWCRPEHRDEELFALLILEGMQAGLSWGLVLAREEAIRAAFEGLRPETAAAFDESKIEAILTKKNIIANRLKVRAVVTNARAFLQTQKEWGSFDRYIWHFTAGKVIDHRLQEGEEPPAQDELSAARRYYNGTVKEFNTRFDVFPSSLIARHTGLNKRSYFELESAEERTAPTVSF